MAFVQRQYLKILLIVFGFGIGFWVGHVQGVSEIETAIKESLLPIKESGTSHQFVHPLLAYRTPEAVQLGEYTELKDAYVSMDRSVKREGVKRLAVYFRDLEAGRWVGVNQDDAFHPASLLKVPAMIAYYKYAEKDPFVLQEKVSYDPAVTPFVPFGAASALVPWRTYSVQTLIDRMIVDSDNGATFALLDHINWEYLNGVYMAFGIPDPGDDSLSYTLSPRTQSLFFRVLYNATYLSTTYSERALALLAKTTYNKGIVAGVPEGVTVAHKYGEHVLADGTNVRGVELSDCGIVYYPEHPYMLCIMTSANDLQSAEKVIAQVSSMTYSAMVKQYEVQ